MNIIQSREKKSGEESYYEVNSNFPGSIQSKQGESIGKWFIPLESLDENFCLPNQGDCYLVTHLHPSVFVELPDPEPEVFDLRAWELNVVEPAVRAHIEGVIRPLPLDYISIHEPNTWVNDTEFGAEALAVQAWIRDCWRAMKTQIEGLQAAIEIEVIIQNLPALEL